ncbi:DUF4139 domain-containing protein [Capnocytophaga catalasegens]|nr:DUF4139 domain-containing protein [Capnocytophaga catalasegens]
MKKRIFFLVFISMFAIAQAQKPLFTNSKLESVKVYFNSAECTHSLSVTLPKGVSELIVKDVSDLINSSSVQVFAPKNVSVLSVQFSTDYMSEYQVDETSAEIKKVHDSISLIKAEIKRVANSKATEIKTIELLDKNQVVGGSNTGVNVLELSKVVEFYNNKRNTILNNIDKLTEREDKLKQTLSRLENRLDVSSSQEKNTSRGKLILQVMSSVAQKADFKLNYLTSGVYWQPFYELNVTDITSPIQLIYKAKIVQKTGLDWKNVKLSLTSGNPNQNNSFPVLQAWYVYMQEPTSTSAISERTMYVQNAMALSAKKTNKEVTIQEEAKSIGNLVTTTDNQLNISFDIQAKYDILSNGKAHSVALTEVELPATYTYYCAPRKGTDVFLLAEVENYSNYNLLAGEANVIFEQIYVGKTQIDPNQTGEKLRLALGKDPRVSVKYEKISDKSGTKFMSSNKEQTFTYDISVRNNKRQNIDLVLKDQYPLSSTNEISVELLESSKALTDLETGILTWETKLKPNELQKYRVSYKVKYPKNSFIPNL